MLWVILHYCSVKLTLSVGDQDTEVGPRPSNSVGSIECHS